MCLTQLTFVGQALVCPRSYSIQDLGSWRVNPRKKQQVLKPCDSLATFFINNLVVWCQKMPWKYCIILVGIDCYH
jgi:hypothetical protein